MRSIFFSAVAAVTLVSASSTSQAAGPAPSFDWTGFYIGAHAGYGWGRTEFSDLDSYLIGAGLNTRHDWDFNGALGGIQAGRYWQTGPLVYGAELDVAWTGMKDRVVHPANPILFFETAVGWFGTGRATMGYALDRGLIYLTGGFAYGRVTNRFDDFGDTLFAATTGVKWGWTAGAGAEYAFAPGWSLRGEYLYVDLADSRASFTDSNPTTFRFAFDNRFHVARIALNYRFVTGGAQRP